MLKILEGTPVRLMIPSGGRVRLQVRTAEAGEWLDVVDVGNRLVDDDGTELEAKSQMLIVMFAVEEVKQ